MFYICKAAANHCYGNSQAERPNGILTREYGLGDGLVSKQATYQAVTGAVSRYNHRRPPNSRRF